MQSCRSSLAVALPALIYLLVGPFSIAAADTLSDLRGSWEGKLDYSDEPLSLRLHVAPDSVYVDYPDLLFARQQVQVSTESGALTFDLPMMGTFEVSLESGRLVGEQTLASGATIIIDLERARAFEPQRDEATFGDDDAVAGTLTVPPGDGPFPVAILLAGASNPTRANVSYRSWDDHLSRNGIATLAYDRRPDDEYAPDGVLWDLDDHADDIVSAIDDLVADDRIDRDRIYLIAKSRGGWIALAAAARDPRVAAIVGIGVAAVSMWQQDLQSIDARMRAEQESEADIQRALAYTQLYFATARTPSLWAALQRASAAAKESSWGSYVRIPEKPGDLEWFRANSETDPATMLARLQIPLFLAWGSDDRTVPAAPNLPLFEWLVEPGSAARSVFRIYPNAGHTLEGPLNVDDDPETVWQGINADFVSHVTQWLAELSKARD